MVRILLLSVLCTCTCHARVANLWKRVGFQDAPRDLETRCLSTSLGFFIPKSGSAQRFTIRVLENSNIATNIETLPNECGYKIEDDARGVEFKVNNDACCVHTKNGKRTVNIHLEEAVDGQTTQAWRFTLDCPLNLRSLRIGESSACASTLPHVRCGDASARSDRDACSRKGCCYDPIRQVCLYGEAACTTDGRFVITVSRNLTWPPLNLSTVHLSGDLLGCGPVVLSPDHVVFDFSVNSCGVTTRWNEVELVYGALVTAEHELCVDGDVAITKSSTFKLLLECRLLRTDERAFLGVQVNTYPPPVPATAIGTLFIELRVATDGDYLDYYSQFPVVKFLRDPIFLEVRLLDHPDPSLVLVLQDCWATPTPDPLNSVQWRVLDNHCPFTGDNFPTVLHPMTEFPDVPLAMHRKRLEVKTFAFAGPQGNVLPNGQANLYFHCRAYVCQGDDRSCVPACPLSRLKRQVGDVVQRDHSLATSEGAVVLLEKKPTTGASTLSSLLNCDGLGCAALALCGLALLAILCCTLLVLGRGYIRLLNATRHRGAARRSRVATSTYSWSGASGC
ncbi:zona pellucida sperm-binding protein 4-like [Lampetra fluviatilis]